MGVHFVSFFCGSLLSIVFGHYAIYSGCSRLGLVPFLGVFLDGVLLFSTLFSLFSTLIAGLFGWLFQNFFLSNKRSGVFFFLFRGSGRGYDCHFIMILRVSLV